MCHGSRVFHGVDRSLAAIAAPRDHVRGGELLVLRALKTQRAEDRGEVRGARHVPIAVAEGVETLAQVERHGGTRVRLQHGRVVGDAGIARFRETRELHGLAVRRRAGGFSAPGSSRTRMGEVTLAAHRARPEPGSSPRGACPWMVALESVSFVTRRLFSPALRRPNSEPTRRRSQRHITTQLASRGQSYDARTPASGRGWGVRGFDVGRRLRVERGDRVHLVGSLRGDSPSSARRIGD